MDSTRLRPEQAAVLREQVRRQLRYLNKLCSRLQTLRFPLDDPLCREALRARDAIQGLYTAALASGEMSETDTRD